LIFLATQEIRKSIIPRHFAPRDRKSTLWFRIPKMSFISKLFSGKNLKRLEGVVLLINNFEEKIKALSDADLKSKSAELKDRILQGTPEEDIIPEAFALVREADNGTEAF